MHFWMYFLSARTSSPLLLTIPTFCSIVRYSWMTASLELRTESRICEGGRPQVQQRQHLCQTVLQAGIRKTVRPRPHLLKEQPGDLVCFSRKLFLELLALHRVDACSHHVAAHHPDGISCTMVLFDLQLVLLQVWWRVLLPKLCNQLLLVHCHEVHEVVKERHQVVHRGRVRLHNVKHCPARRHHFLVIQLDGRDRRLPGPIGGRESPSHIPPKPGRNQQTVRNSSQSHPGLLCTQAARVAIVPKRKMDKPR